MRIIIAYHLLGGHMTVVIGVIRTPHMHQKWMNDLFRTHIVSTILLGLSTQGTEKKGP